MKIVIVITTFNRPKYLERCLNSIKRSDLKDADLLLLDDASTDKRVFEVAGKYPYPMVKGAKNEGICFRLLHIIPYLFNEGYDIVINLDSDSLVRNDWMEVLLKLHKDSPNQIITGFHSTTKNADGSERHKIIGIGEGCVQKKSVGGINMLFTKETFEKYAKPALEYCIAKGGNWDHMTCINAGSVICSVPSVIQHIGIESSLGHTHDRPDVADDFKMLSLPNVTLVCVDDDYRRGGTALNKCSDLISFGYTRLFSSNYDNSFEDKDRVVNIPKLGSKEAYSKFILKELYKYIDTDYALIIQHDGYVKNPEAWTDEFLKYDYIGAPWWYKDGHNVGNGGFSLRSKKLLQCTAGFFSKLTEARTHPEDHQICRTYRKQFEELYNITFAPEELAAKFSFEGWNQLGTWSGQFGFHSHRAFVQPPDKNKPGFIINQFLGLGDILFLVPLVRKWMAQGHDIVWPIADEYFGIKQNFPDIQFVKKSAFPMNYDIRKEFWHRWQYGRYLVKPMRWNMCTKIEDCMTTKYTQYGEDWNMWRSLRWQRDYEKEKKLSNKVGTSYYEKYELYFENYGSIPDGPCERKIENSGLLPSIKVQPIEGYTLLDWAGIIENASAIHAVSSSCIYLFEMLNLKCEVNLYARKQGERDFEYVRKLLTKKYKFHL